LELILVTSEAKVATATSVPTLATLLAAVGRDDLSGVRAQLRQAATMLGPVRFVVEVAHPLCVRVGALWAEGQLEVRHEHLLSECLSAQLRVLLSAFEDRPGAPRVLLATLPGERHGLGLALAAVYLASSQVTPILLGVDTPAPQIVKAAQSHQVDAVGLLVTAASDLTATAKQIRWMLTELPRRVGIWVGGAAGSELTLHDEAVRIIGSWGLLDSAIESLARTTA
jgi:cobalamin-dependent methionine synthase I